MRQILILWHILIFPLWLVAQNCGLEDTLNIAVNRTNINYTFEITDVINNDLANPSQGICGVEIMFRHNFSENLELWLTSPAGQRIQLIGPNTTDNTAFTFGTLWNINFVPCAETAQPDSGYVAKWNNGQQNNFVNGGRYRGSYYPFVGCLEDFNTGSINGTWTITYTNNPSPYPGAITHFRLRLCDERGFLCCDANAGSLAAFPDVEGCAGSDALNLKLKPSYTGMIQPDTIEYGYTYLISKDGILIEYDSLADCRDLPAGNYQVCGLSYRRSDLDSFPQPDGTIRLDDLRRRLNGDSLLYCGRMTTNCVDVRITSGDTVLLQRDICQGESVQIGNQTFTTTGDYFINLPGSGGCDSIVNLKLAVVPGVVTNLDTTICAGDSIVVGNSIYKTSGTYSDTLAIAGSCDSIVHLNLTVRNVLPTFLTEVICQGETYSAGGQTFSVSGQYDITLPSASGCDSLINLTLLVLQPIASIANPEELSCTNPSVTLDGSASAPDGAISFVWTNINGDTLGVDSTLTVDSAGFYILTVTQTVADFSCISRDTVEVVSIADVPVADAGMDFELNCSNFTVEIGGANTSIGPNYTYHWRIVNGNIVGDTTQRTATVDASGEYILIVTNTLNGCSDTASTRVIPNFTSPIADIIAQDTLSCDQTSIVLEVGNASRGDTIEYIWRNSSNVILGTDSIQQISAPGVYFLEVLNVRNGCTAQDSIEIQSGIGVPVVSFGDTLIPCDVDTFSLQAFVSPPNGNYSVFWTGTGVIGSGDALTTPIDQPGEYILTVINLDNDCIINEFVTVTKETDCPELCIEGNLPDTLTCLKDTIQLIAAYCEPCNNCTLQWTTLDGNIVAGADSLAPFVNAPGTYTLTVTNQNGESRSIDLTVVQVLDLPTADAGTDQIITCNQDSVEIGSVNSSTGAAFVYEWRSASGNLINPNNTRTINIRTPDTYILQVRNNLTGCSAQDTVVVTLDTTGLMANAGVPQVLSCTDTIARLDGSGSSRGANILYNWTTIDGNIVSGTDSLNPVVNAPGTYLLRVTQNNCSVTDTVTVTTDTTGLTANAGFAQVLTCTDTIARLDGGGSSSGANITYRWTTVGGNIVSGVDSLSPVVNAPGIYVLLVTQNNCAAVDSVEVSSDESVPPVPTFSDEFLTCLNPTVTLDASAFVGGTLIGRWCQIDSNDMASNCLDNPLFFVNTAGRYRFEITDTTSGCHNFATVRVIDNSALPMVDAGTSDTLDCVQPSLMLDASVLPATGDYRYRWTALNGSAVSNDTILTPTTTLPDIYILEVTNQTNGCIARDSVEILQNAEVPSIFAGFDTLLTCTVARIQLEGTALGNNLKYEWVTTTGNIVSGADSLNPTIDQPGAYFFRVTNQLSNCVAQDTLVVGQNIFEPNAAVRNSDELNLDCASNAVNLDGCVSLSQTGASLRYRWQALNGATLPNPDSCSIAVSRSGDYQLFVEDLQNGCRDSLIVTVNQNPDLPSVNIDIPEPLTCNRDTAILNAQISGNGSNFGISWISPTGQILSDSTLNLAVALPGNYTFVILNRTTSCSDSTTINVASDTTKPTITIAPPNSLECQVSSVQLVATATNGTRFSYNWTTTEGSILSGGDSSTATVNAGGNYTVLVTNLDNGCTNQAVTGVKQGESSIQQAFFTVTPANCIRQGSGFIQMDSVSGGTAPYLYALGEFSFAPDPFFQNIRAGEYTLRVQDINGCEWETKVTVPAPQPITVDLGGDTLINFGDTIQLTAILDTGRLQQIIWLTNGDTSHIAATQVTVAPPLSSQYRVVVTATNGCTASDIVNIAVTQITSVFTPNVFTPDGDGINDVFMVYAGQNVKQVKVFMIFDRWGNRLLHDGPFQPNDAAHGWDGTFNSKPMDAGVYVFYAEVEIVDGRTEIIKGDITLLR